MRISIFSASTRINRQSHRVALALQHYLRQYTDHSVEILDLAAYQFQNFYRVIGVLP